MFITVTILAQLLFITLLILFLYRIHPRFGLGPLFLLIGANQFFQTILTTSFTIDLFGGLTISSGSSILFSASLFTILLIYIKHGVKTTQRLILAIIIANISTTILSLIVNQQEIAMHGINSQLFHVNFRIFFVGTVVLILDAFLIVILYEILFSRVRWLNLYTRLLIAMLVTLNFDAILFSLGSFWDWPHLSKIIISQVIAKTTVSIYFATMLFLYLRYVDIGFKSDRFAGAKENQDIFSILTYKGRYEKLKTDKAHSEEQLKKLISAKTTELEKTLRRYTIMASVRELRIDKFSTAEQAKEFLVKVKEAFEVDACTIHLIKNEELKMLSSIGIAEESKVFKMMYTFPYFKKIIEEKQSLCIEDTSMDPEIYKEFIKDSNIFKYKSCAGALLLSGDKVSGLLKLYTINNNRSFSELEMEHLQLIASQIAQSIEANQLYEQNEKHKEILVKQIVARKKVESAIKESEEKYRGLIENASDPIMIYQFDGTILDSNKSTSELTGYDKGELLKLKITDLLFQEDIVEKPFQFEIIKEGKTTIVERRMKHKNGSSVDVEVNNRMMPDGTIMVVGRDLTERKKAEKEIKQSNERFELIGKAANDALWEWNLETNELWGNEEHQKLYGLTLNDPVPDDEEWRKNLHNEDRTRIQDSLQKVLDSDINIWDGEYRLHTVNKGAINVYGRTYIERNEKGKPIRMLGSMMDITSRKENELQILKERNLSDSIINSLPGVFYLFDDSPRFLRWNRNFEKVSGYNAEEFSSMAPMSLFLNRDKPIMKKQIDRVRNDGFGNSEAILIIKSGEEIPYYFTGVRIIYEGKNCVLGYGVDITERKKSEEEILEINIQLQNLSAHLQNVREEERRRIGREIHDDLGQQLTAIKMDVAWIDKKTPEDAAMVKSKLKNIISLLDGSNQSVRRILNELKPSILDEYGLLDAIEWHSKQFTANTGIPVKINTNEENFRLAEDVATCIFRVVQESLTNITRHAEAKKVFISIEIISHKIIVTIEDDGKGFDVNLVKAKGTFGLLGMKERVRALAGQLAINSIIGSGTAIKITFPYINK